MFFNVRILGLCFIWVFPLDLCRVLALFCLICDGYLCENVSFKFVRFRQSFSKCRVMFDVLLFALELLSLVEIGEEFGYEKWC